MKPITLDSFHNKWLVGFSFCQKAYKLFNQIKSETNGLEHLRIRESELEKKLLEEILPLAKFVQIKTRPGNELKIKWMNGNQQFDACFVQFGSCVDNGFSIQKGHLEVTGVYHPNHYLANELLNSGETFFGCDGLMRDKKTKTIHSTPIAKDRIKSAEHIATLAIGQIKRKSEISYPDNTILIVECSLANYYYEHEWHHFLGNVRENMPSHSFNEILLYDSLVGQYAYL
jgi:hypothetical protein